MSIIKKFYDYLLRKGFGRLTVKVFVAKPTTELNEVIISGNFYYCTIDNHVLNDISIARGEKKYKQLKKIMGNGGYGVSLYHSSELAAYGWVGINKENQGRRQFTTFKIPPQSAHIFDCYTIERFRGQKLYQAIVFKLVEWSRSQHINNVYIDTIAGNKMAEKGINKLGFEYLSIQTKGLFFSKILFEYDHKG